MNLQSNCEMKAARQKLRELEELYGRTAVVANGNYSRDLTLRSLKQTINQVKEEIARIEARSTSVAGQTTPSPAVTTDPISAPRQSPS
jgi:hypothetical protein